MASLCVRVLDPKGDSIFPVATKAVQICDAETFVDVFHRLVPATPASRITSLFIQQSRQAPDKDAVETPSLEANVIATLDVVHRSEGWRAAVITYRVHGTDASDQPHEPAQRVTAPTPTRQAILTETVQPQTVLGARNGDGAPPLAAIARSVGPATHPCPPTTTQPQTSAATAIPSGTPPLSEDAALAGALLAAGKQSSQPEAAAVPEHIEPAISAPNGGQPAGAFLIQLCSCFMWSG